MSEQAAKATVKVKATMAAVKIHGPNSPQVLAGEVEEGHRDPIAMDNPGPQLIEMDYQACLAHFGREKADELFRGIPEEDR